VTKGLQEIEAQLQQFNNKQSASGEILKKDLLFIEAFTASRYWQTIGLKLPAPFSFTNRVKKNATDMFNPQINYLYGMLRHQTESAILSIGLDPALGILHRDGYRMPSLVFDLMEPFRPVIDRLLIMSILSDGDSLPEATSSPLDIPLLSKPTRKQLISMFNTAMKTRIRYRNAVTTIQNHILTEAKKLSEQIKLYGK
jgi:CRISPR-associated protein Cas1